MKKISVLGIDLGKNVFHLHRVDAHGKIVLQKKLNGDNEKERNKGRNQRHQRPEYSHHDAKNSRKRLK